MPDDHPLFDLLVIDETSRLKDPSGKRARALLKIAGRFRTRWGLTGTPRPNSSMDLFMPAAIITDGALWGRAFVPWQKRHFRPRDPVRARMDGAARGRGADRRRVRHRRDDGRRRGHARPAAAQRRGDARRAAGRRHGDLPDDAAGAVRRRSKGARSRPSRRWSRPASCAQLANGFLYGEGNDDPVDVHTLKIDWLRELVESLDGEPLLIAYEFIEDLRAIRRAFGEVPALGGLTPAREAARLVEALERGRAAAARLSSGLGRARAQPAARRVAHGVAVADLVGRAAPSRRSRGSTGRGRRST